MKTAFPVVGELTPRGSKAKAGKANCDSIITTDEGVKYSIGDTDYNVGKIKETPIMVEGELTPFGLEAERRKEVSANNITL